jgi:3-isopropylmalate dehydrogenase
LANPGEIDFVVVREGTEGLYLGQGEVKNQGTKQETAVEFSINTVQGLSELFATPLS